jgi:hypothetical protein
MAISLTPVRCAQTKVIKDGSPMTMDMRSDRVRVMVDENGKVARAPRIG